MAEDNRRSFDLKSWQGLTEVLKFARESNVSPEEYGSFRNLVLQYAQEKGSDPALKKKIDDLILTFYRSREEAEKGKKLDEKQTTHKQPERTGRRVIPSFMPTFARVESLDEVRATKEAQAEMSVVAEHVVTPPPTAAEVIVPSPVPVSVPPLPQQSEMPPLQVPAVSLVDQALSGTLKSIDEHKARITDIKHRVNLLVGNPIALVDHGNTIGRDYMAALLNALKASSPGSTINVEDAMARLENTFKVIVEYHARMQGGDTSLPPPAPPVTPPSMPIVEESPMPTPVTQAPFPVIAEVTAVAIEPATPPVPVPSEPIEPQKRVVISPVPQEKQVRVFPTSQGFQRPSSPKVDDALPPPASRVEKQEVRRIFVTPRSNVSLPPQQPAMSVVEEEQVREEVSISNVPPAILPTPTAPIIIEEPIPEPEPVLPPVLPSPVIEEESVLPMEQVPESQVAIHVSEPLLPAIPMVEEDAVLPIVPDVPVDVPPAEALLPQVEYAQREHAETEKTVLPELTSSAVEEEVARAPVHEEPLPPQIDETFASRTLGDISDRGLVPEEVKVEDQVSPYIPHDIKPLPSQSDIPKSEASPWDADGDVDSQIAELRKQLHSIETEGKGGRTVSVPSVVDIEQGSAGEFGTRNLTNRPTSTLTGVSIDTPQAELMSPDVTMALTELLHEWNIFASSGLFGFGPGGVEHPLYIKLSSLPMGEVLAGRFEGVDMKVVRTIKEYINAWRHEQGIAYTPSETFEHYLRRVSQRILKRQQGQGV